MRRALVVIALASITLAACSSSSKPASTTTTTVAPTSTTAGAPLSTTTITTIPAPTTTIATTIKESVYIVSVDPAAHTITVDPMEFLSGEAATTEYHKVAPNEPGGPPNDYFIVNPTKDRVVLPLQAKAPILVVDLSGAAGVQTVPVSQTAFAASPTLGVRPFWITVERGSVARVEEQYVP